MKLAKVFVYLIVTLIFCHYLFGIEIVDSVNKSNDNSISVEVAIEKALLYSGFDKLKDYSMSEKQIIAEKKIFRDTTTLFIKDSAAEKLVWSVKFEDICLDALKGNSTDVYPSIYEVILDSHTGKLMQITSYSVDDRQANTSMILSILKENDLRILSKFTGFPDCYPQNTFVEILAPDVRKKPYSFKNIMALYVLYSYDAHTPKPYWCLILQKRAGGEVYTTSDPLYGREVIQEVVSSIIIIDDETNRSKIIKINAANIEEDSPEENKREK